MPILQSCHADPQLHFGRHAGTFSTDMHEQETPTTPWHVSSNMTCTCLATCLGPSAFSCT